MDIGIFCLVYSSFSGCFLGFTKHWKNKLYKCYQWYIHLKYYNLPALKPLSLTKFQLLNASSISILAESLEELDNQFAAQYT